MRRTDARLRRTDAHNSLYIYIYHDGGGSVDGYCVESMLVLIVFRMGLGGRGGMFFG